MNEVANVRTNWLVDTENTGNRWLCLLDMAKPGDVIHMFVSDKSCTIVMSDLMKSGIVGFDFRFYSCENGIANAMDFQMMCALGMLVKSGVAERFVIVSCDNGFKSVLFFMSERGYDVSVFEPLGKKEIEESFEIVGVIDSIRSCIGSDISLTDNDLCKVSLLLSDVSSISQNKRKLTFLNRLRKMFGNDIGLAVYRLLRSMVDSNVVSPKLTKSDKVKKALQGVLKKVPDTRVQEIMQMMAKARKTCNPAQSLTSQCTTLFKSKDTAQRVVSALQGLL